MSRTWLLLLAATAAAAQTAPQTGGQAIMITVDGKPFSEVIVSGTKPYLHPIRTASGQVVSQSGPLDHIHHRGLWFSHGDVNGWDFWANEPNQKGVGKGRGEIRTKRVWVSGSVATLEADWVDGTRQPLLHERRIMTFSGGPNLRIIDFDATLTAVADTKFGDTKEGTFAIRLVDELTEKKGSGKLRSAEGAEGMNAIWGTASPWVDYSGTLNGEAVGVTIYDHPDNPRYPTRWHARDYGLFAANIFGLHDFLRDKTKDGSLTLITGKSAQFRYRVVIHNGPGFDPVKHVPAR